MNKIGRMEDLIPEEYQDFADLLDEYLEKNSRFGAWLADNLEVSRATITRWRSGAHRPGDAYAVRRICDLFALDQHQSQKLFKAAKYEYIESKVSGSASLSFLPSVQAICPYKGLDAFGLDDASMFFGRDAEISELLKALSKTRFFSVNGPSGSGKSSIVRAGLLPKLADEGINGQTDGIVLTLRPGERPLDRLASEVHSLDDHVDESTLNILIEQLEIETNTLWRSIHQRLLKRTERYVVIVVDQFEEVFTLCHKQSKRQAFIENLFHAATVSDGKVYVVITLRADHYGTCAEFPELVTLINENSMLVGPMSSSELEEAITQPAQNLDCNIEPMLVHELLSDAKREPNSLPLLQYMLLQLWQSRIHDGMTLDAYKELGGISNVIAERANSEFGRLSNDQQTIARNIFLRLIQLGDGVEDTRRRIRLSQVLPQDERRDVVQKIIDAFVYARLLTLGYEETLQEQTIEVTHEALITHWEELRNWLEEERGDEYFLRRATEAAEEWQEIRDDTNYLFLGERLARLQRLSEKLSDLEKEFLDESLLYQEEISAASIRSKVSIISVSGLFGGFTGGAIGPLLFSSNWTQSLPWTTMSGAFYGAVIALTVAVIRHFKNYQLALSVIGCALAGMAVIGALLKFLEFGGAPHPFWRKELIEGGATGILIAIITTENDKFNLIVAASIGVVFCVLYYIGLGIAKSDFLPLVLAFGIALLINISNRRYV